MNNIRITVLFFALALYSGLAFAQYENPDTEIETTESKKKQRKSNYAESPFFFGGNLGLSFGTYTYVELAPLAGYKITPRLWAGIGPKYMYEKYQDYYERSAYGLKVFGLYTVFKDLSETIKINLGDIFFYAENESINIDSYSPAQNGVYYRDGREWVNIMLIGGGMRFPIGGRAGFSLLALWDVTQHPYYAYANPEIRIIFDF